MTLPTYHQMTPTGPACDPIIWCAGGCWGRKGFGYDIVSHFTEGCMSVLFRPPYLFWGLALGGVVV